MFELDGASCHTANSTKKWFKNHDIPLFPQPPNSPDLPPIEPLWHHLKEGVHKLERFPADVHELNAAVQHVWDKMEQDIVDCEFARMPEEVRHLKKVKGNYTPF
jgi:hypothetical protein